MISKEEIDAWFSAECIAYDLAWVKDIRLTDWYDVSIIPHVIVKLGFSNDR